MSTSFKNGNVAVAGNAGRVGNIRYVQRYGKTYTRMAGCDMTNPRTYTQQERRMRFASLAALWSRLKYHFGGMFEKDAPELTDFNMFTRLNKDSGIYLCKDETHLQTIMLPVQISKGSIPSIAYTFTNGQMVSNIKFKEGFEIDEHTTVHDFVSGLDYTNEMFEFENDEELIFVKCLQKESDLGEQKRYDIQVVLETVPLIYNDERLLRQVASAEGFQVVNGYLGTAPNLPKGCFGYVLRRKIDQKTSLYSSQTLVNNNVELIAHYTTKEQFLKAGNSYGKMQHSRFYNDENEEIEKLIKRYIDALKEELSQYKQQSTEAK